MQFATETETVNARQSTSDSPREEKIAKRWHRKVAIIQREIPHYRAAFFSAVEAAAQRFGLSVTVYSGDGGNRADHFPFKHQRLPIIRFGTGNGAPCWLSGLTDAIADADILVVPQELQCLNVLNLWLRRHSLGKVWIWWGHGYNFQAGIQQNWKQGLLEQVKHFITPRSNGLITYSNCGAEYWVKHGIPREKVVSYLNTIDVADLRQRARRIADAELRRVRQDLDIEGKHVLLFSGRLYAEKEVEFLLEAFCLLQQTIPDTALLIVGEGEERDRLVRLRHELGVRHVHFLGELVDSEQSSLYFMLAEVLVIPGLVGLAIVHGFAFGLPLITTERNFHSPEIEYLTPETGLMTKHHLAAYATGIAVLLKDSNRLEGMRLAARQKADQLTLESSAKRFATAISQFSN